MTDARTSSTTQAVAPSKGRRGRSQPSGRLDQPGRRLRQERGKSKTGADFDANMQKGLDAYGKALALKPDDAGLHNNYGLALAKAKKFAEAQAELKKAAELDPPNGGKYYYNLGALLDQRRPAGGCRRCLQEGHRADPDLRRCLLPVRRHPARPGQDRSGHRKSHSSAGYGRGIPEVPGIGAHRPICPAGQGHAGVSRTEPPDRVRRSQRQEKEEVAGSATARLQESSTGRRHHAAAPIPCFVPSFSISSYPSFFSCFCVPFCVGFSPPPSPTAPRSPLNPPSPPAAN